jgi:hypothetical protein
MRLAGRQLLAAQPAMDRAGTPACPARLLSVPLGITNAIQPSLF